MCSLNVPVHCTMRCIKWFGSISRKWTMEKHTRVEYLAFAKSLHCWWNIVSSVFLITSEFITAKYNMKYNMIRSRKLESKEEKYSVDWKSNTRINMRNVEILRHRSEEKTCKFKKTDTILFVLSGNKAQWYMAETILAVQFYQRITSFVQRSLATKWMIKHLNKLCVSSTSVNSKYVCILFIF